MIITTALGKMFECAAITSIPSPPRLYLHLVKTSFEKVAPVFADPRQLPIVGYNDFRALQSISAEGETGVKVSLKKSGT